MIPARLPDVTFLVFIQPPDYILFVKHHDKFTNNRTSMQLMIHFDGVCFLDSVCLSDDRLMVSYFKLQNSKIKHKFLDRF